MVKGSVPARTDVSVATFDACGKKAIADAKEATAKGTLLGTMAHGHAAPEAVKNAVYDVVTEFFNSDKSSAEAARNSLQRWRTRSNDNGRGAGPTAGAPSAWGGDNGDRRRARRGSGPLHGLAEREPAEARARADLRHHALLRLRLHPVDDVPVEKSLIYFLKNYPDQDTESSQE